ncbi:MAG TPA: amidophosphoribosyltransferase [Bacillota bacterium]|nr:amidophosphoribosyltransferase [Bacillota bacterium]HOP68399.1 amidophosphoribosyltransferase [Bacillota bacterium]HPT33505.1 amidophosphoribosyltransferase [Bacillota bacterium]HQD06755.1 amidophosphoribosyltransferase [Bacillota bacterium]
MLDKIEPKLREACGVCGGRTEGLPLAHITCFALYALQHRGQDGAGIAVGPGNGEKMWLKKGMGLVSEVFPHAGELKDLKANISVGHVRYSLRSRGRRLEDTEPLLLRYRYGELAIAHNGILLNGASLRRELEEQGAIFQSGTDSELLGHLVAREANPCLEEALAAVVPRLKGAFAFVLSDGRKVIALRDGHGFRPLSLGHFDDRGFFFASETCAFDTIGARFLRDLAPGEMVVLDEKGVHSCQIIPPVSRQALCVFELVYFARPDSNLAGKNVHLVRRALGRQLALEQPADADIVSGVPDSSIAAASGYAEQAGLPYEMALVKNRYIGRTFIQPTQEMREEGADLKLNAVRKIVEGKRVVLVDDSIVRGTTSIKLVQMMRRVGAREIHLRISSPPVIASCRYGIDTPDTEELMAYKNSPEEIARLIGADSIGFLSHEGAAKAIGLPAGELCWACFSGKYPVD